MEGQETVRAQSVQGIFALIILVTTACAADTLPGGSTPAGGPNSASVSAGPKVLTIAMRGEPVTFEGFTGQGGSAGGAGQVGGMVHDHLTITDPLAVQHPQLAVEVP